MLSKLRDMSYCNMENTKFPSSLFCKKKDCLVLSDTEQILLYKIQTVMKFNKDN